MRLHGVEDIEDMKDAESTGIQIISNHRDLPRDLGA